MAQKKSDRKKSAEKKQSIFEKASLKITEFTGSFLAFALAFSLVLVWGITGPIFDFSEGWQLVINTGTTIITFLMVFLIQHSQNKDTMALQLKLDELIIAVGGASNDLVDAESYTEEELKALKHHYTEISEITGDLKISRLARTKLPKRVIPKNSKPKKTVNLKQNHNHG
jgi:low affinity Fe/Cu permease